MRSRMIVALALVLAVGIGACKSVETTSAIIHNDTGRFDLAIEQCRKSLEKDPNDAEAHFQLGVAHSGLDSVGLAYADFTKAAELDPKKEKLVNNNIQSNFAKHFNNAISLSQDGNVAGAAAEFEKATQADPRQSKAYYNLGNAYMNMGLTDAAYYPRAIGEFDKVLELSSPADRQYIDALSYEGEIFARMGQPEEAISRFNRLIDEDPTNYRVIEDIGYDLLDEKNWKGATVFLELASQARAKVGAEDFNLYYNIGVAYFQSRDQDETALAKAIDYYRRALDLQPDEPQTVFNIMVAYSAAKEWPQVVTWGEKYVSINPDSADAWRLMARGYNEMGDEGKARECAARYDEIQKRGPE